MAAAMNLRPTRAADAIIMGLDIESDRDHASDETTPMIIDDSTSDSPLPRTATEAAFNHCAVMETSVKVQIL